MESLDIAAVVEEPRTAVAAVEDILLGTVVEVQAVQTAAVVAPALRNPTNQGQLLLQRWEDRQLSLYRQSHQFYRPSTLLLMPPTGWQDAQSFDAQRKNWSRTLPRQVMASFPRPSEPVAAVQIRSFLALHLLHGFRRSEVCSSYMRPKLRANRPLLLDYWIQMQPQWWVRSPSSVPI